jgi:TonB family protein
MHFNRAAFRIASGGVLIASLSAQGVGAQEPPQAVSIQTVKDLYASAAYEDALTAMGKPDPEAPNLEAEQYRVFCLVALGRLDDADKAVETVLSVRPEYHPDAAEASPRIQAIYAKVRRRIGPGLVKRMYQQGKSAMDRKEREEAISRFEAMLRIAEDPDVRNEPNIAELRELGTGFLELTRATPPKPVPPPTPPAPANTAAVRQSVIVPPVAIRQQLPGWVPDPVSRATEFRGSVRVQISAQGKVTDAEMIKSLHPAYDQLVIRAARAWVYEPAKKDGTPIASEKIVQISVTPPPAGQGRTADKSLPF